VQDAVRKEHRELGDQVVPVGSRLAPSRRHAEDDVAQDIAREIGQWAVALGKGQNVRGAILPAVCAIQLLNRRVSGQHN
jgi:hypothetical protein